MKSTPSSTWGNLPGGEYVAEGLNDLANEKTSVASLLLAIAAQRLAGLGLALPAVPTEPELRLYRLLRARHGDDAHGQYNAHLRRLASLCHALESRDARERTALSSSSAPRRG